MEYLVKDNQIIIKENKDFNIKHIVECGQMFRYKKHENGYLVYAGDKQMVVNCHKGTSIIFCDDVNFAINYFDLHTNYDKIKQHLISYSFLKKPIQKVYGIRILRQQPLEMIISFIISANNNIPRIKKTIEQICENYGTNMGDYYAFPTLTQLATIPVEFFKSVGAGYRDKYLVETIKALSSGFDIERLYSLDAKSARNELTKLMGVGRKVADCILLFGYGKTDVFPTDTWITKVYNENFKKSLPPNNVSQEMQKIFGHYSGYAQQYLFYERMIRDKKGEV